VIALLPVKCEVFIPEPFKALARKGVVRALRLLQTKNVRSRCFDEFCNEIDAKSHRIDVPGRNLELHRIGDQRDGVRELENSQRLGQRSPFETDQRARDLMIIHPRIALIVDDEHVRIGFFRRIEVKDRDRSV
jgi:hypothetical protein